MSGKNRRGRGRRRRELHEMFANKLPLVIDHKHKLITLINLDELPLDNYYQALDWLADLRLEITMKLNLIKNTEPPSSE